MSQPRNSPLGKHLSALKQESIDNSIQQLTYDPAGEARGNAALLDYLNNSQSPVQSIFKGGDPEKLEQALDATNFGINLQSPLNLFPSLSSEESSNIAGRLNKALEAANKASGGAKIFSHSDIANSPLFQQAAVTGTVDGKKGLVDKQEDSLAFKITGGDPTSALGSTANLVASLIDSTTAIGESIINAPDRVRQLTAEVTLPNEYRAILNKMHKGEALSPSEELMAQTPIAMNPLTSSLFDGGFNIGNSAPDELVNLHQFKALNKQASDIIKTREDAIKTTLQDPTAMAKLSKDFVDTWNSDNVSVKQAILNIPTIAMDNPQAAAELIVGVIPDMAMFLLGGGLGASASAVSSLGMAMAVTGEAIDERRAAGEELSSEQMGNMFNLTLAHALADYVGDYAVAGAARGAKKVGTALAGEATEVATKEASKSLLKAALGGTARVVNKVAGKYAIATTGEGISEGAQEAIEQTIKGEDLDGAEIFAATGMGAIGGGGVHGVSDAATVGKVARQLTKKKKSEDGNIITDIAHRASREDVKTGDISGFLKKGEKDYYNPVRAVDTLIQHGAANEIDTGETLQKVNDVLADAEAELKAKKSIANISSEEGIAKDRQLIATIDNRLASPDTNPEDIPKLQRAKEIYIIRIAASSEEGVNARAMEAVATAQSNVDTIKALRAAHLKDAKLPTPVADPNQTVGAITEAAGDSFSTPMRTPTPIAENVSRALETAPNDIGNKIPLKALQNQVTEVTPETPMAQVVEASNKVNNARDAKRNEITGLKRMHAKAVATGEAVTVSIDGKGNVKESSNGTITIEPTKGFISASLSAADNSLTALDSMASVLQDARKAAKSQATSTPVEEAPETPATRTVRSAYMNNGKPVETNRVAPETDTRYTNAKARKAMKDEATRKASETSLMAVANNADERTPEELQNALKEIGTLHTQGTLDAFLRAAERALVNSEVEGAIEKLTLLDEQAIKQEAAIIGNERADRGDVFAQVQRTGEQIHDDLVDELPTLNVEDNPQQIKDFIDNAFAIDMPSLAAQALDALEATADTLSEGRIQTIANNQADISQHYDKALAAFNERVGEDFKEPTRPSVTSLYKQVNGDPAATLEVMASPIADDTNYVRTELKQIHRKDLPLTMIKNFMTSIFDGGVAQISQFLPADFMKKLEKGGEEKRTAVGNAIRSFRNFEVAFSEALINSLPEIDFEKDSRVRHPLQYLYLRKTGLDGKPYWELDQNLITAMAYGAYAEIVNNATNATKTDDKIKAMASLKKEDRINDDLRNALQPYEAAPSDIANNIGQTVTDIVGLRNFTKEESLVDVLPRLQASIGAQTILALEEMGLAHRKAVELPGILTPKGNPVKRTFVGFSRDQNGDMAPRIQGLVDMDKGSSQVVGAMFGAESRKVTPSTEPKRVQATDSKGKKHPRTLIDILNKVSARPLGIRNELVGLLNDLDDDFRDSIFGVDQRPEAQIHADKVMAVKSYNEDIIRKWENINEYLSEIDPTQDIYLTNTVQSQQRVGNTQNVLDPQQDALLARAILGYREWNTTVDPSSENSVVEFYTALGESIRIKPDVTSRENIIADTEAQMNSPVVRGGLEVIRAYEANPATPLRIDQQKALTDAVEALGANVESLYAMQEYVKFENARNNGTTFTTNLAGTVDGKSNGQILSMLLFGSLLPDEATEALARGGFFTDVDTKDFADFINQPGQLDYYQNVGSGMLAEVNNFIAARKQAFQALRRNKEDKAAKKALDQHLTTEKGLRVIKDTLGDFLDEDGIITSTIRDLAKTPTISTSFGAGIRRAAQTLGGRFIDKMYDKLEALAREGDTAGIRKYADDLNKMAAYHTKGTYVFSNVRQLTADNVLDIRISDISIKALQNAVFNEIGMPTVRFLESTNALFNERTQSITDSSLAMFDIFNGVKKAYSDEITAQAIDNGEVPVTAPNAKGVQHTVFGLTGLLQQEIDDAAKPFTPWMETLNSKDSNNPETGIVLMDDVKEENLDNRIDIPASGKHKAMTVYAQKWTESNNGVGSVSRPIHSSDNYIGHQVLNKYVGSNQHDALAVSVGDLTTVGKELNKNTVDSAIRYNPLQEMVNTLRRQLTALETLEDEGIKKDAIRNIAQSVINSVAAGGYKALTDISGFQEDKIDRLNAHQSIMSLVLSRAIYNANEAAKNKLTFLQNVENVAQYASLDSHHAVTPKQKADVDAALAELAITHADNLNLLELDVISQIDDAIYSIAFVEEISPTTDLDVVERDVEETTPEELALAKTKHDRAVSFLSTTNQKLNEYMVEGMRGFLSPRMTALIDGYTPSGNNSLQAHLERMQATPADVIAIHEAAQAYLNENTSINPDALGKSAIPDNQELVALMGDGSKPVSAKPVIAHILKKVGKNHPFAPLLEAISATSSANLQIQLLTPTTDAYGTYEDGFTEARGWFSFKSYSPYRNKETIYLRNSDFLNGGINTELVVHELLHASLGKMIEGEIHKAAELRNKGRLLNTELYREIQRLDAVRQQVQETLGDQFPEALSNVHEFVSWGMTNKAFIEALQNTPVTVETKTGPTVKNASRRFREHLLNLFKAAFKRTAWGEKQGQEMLTAFDHLIDGTANLFVMANNQRKGMKKTGASLHSANPEMNQLELFMKTATAAEEQVNGMSLKRLNQALSDAAMEGVHGAELSSLVEYVEDAAYGVGGSNKPTIDPTTISDAFDGVSNEAPAFVSNLQAAPYALHPQERNAAEVLEASLQESLANNKEAAIGKAITNAKSLFDHAAKNLKPEMFYQGDWATATQADKNLAQEKVRFLTSPRSVHGGPVDYLSRFLALTATSAEVQSALAQLPLSRNTNATDIKTRAISIIEETGDWMAGGFTSMVDTAAATTATRAAKKLNAIENARKRELLDGSVSILDGLGEQWDKGYSSFKEGVSKQISKLSPNTRIGAITKDALTIADAMVSGKGFVVGKSFQAIRDSMFNEKSGLLASTAQYIAGYGSKITGLMRDVKHIERLKQERASTVSNLVLKAFEDNGKYLSKDMRKAITNTILRTDSQSLLKYYTPQEIELLVSNDEYLISEIAKANNEVDHAFVTRLSRNYVKTYAEGLGRFMATGATNLPMLPLNAYTLLTRASGKGIYTVDTNVNPQHEALVDRLASLQAIKNTSVVDRQITSQVISRELNKPNGESGVRTLLGTHALVEKESNINFTKQDKQLKIKGYMPEITNPNIELVWAEVDEVKNMELAGYEQVGETHPSLTVKSNLPVVKSKVMMVRRDSVYNERVSGIIPLVDNQMKGTEVMADAFPMLPVDYVNAKSGIRREFLDKMYAVVNGTYTPPAHAREPIPYINEKGEVGGFRYMMDSNLRDTVLERDNDFSTLMGRMSGNTFDKSISMDMAKNLVKEMMIEYRKHGEKEPASFIMISADSANKEMRDIFSKLPLEIQKAYPNIPIRKNLVDVMVGYKKFSVANSFLKDPAERKGFEKAVVGTFEYFFSTWAKTTKGLTDSEAAQYAKRLAPKVLKGERGWKELASEIKSAIVIKTGVVLLANEYSNATLLRIHGVPLKDIFVKKAQYLKELRSFKTMGEEYQTLRYEHQLAIDAAGGVSSPLTDDIRNRMTILEDRLNKSPVKALYDEGFLSTIAEDLNQTKDPYSYRAAIGDKITKALDNMPKAVGDIANTLYMSENTPAFKFMNEMTQYSDFIARMTLYDHLTTRKNNPLTKEAALHEISEAFVIYDMPMPAAWQYADDMFLLPFSKYFLSIQRVIAKNFIERPVSTLGVMMLSDFLGVGDHIQEPFIAGRLGNNPLWPGIFHGVDAFQDILPMKLLGSMFK